MYVVVELFDGDVTEAHVEPTQEKVQVLVVNQNKREVRMLEAKKSKMVYYLRDLVWERLRVAR